MYSYLFSCIFFCSFHKDKLLHTYICKCHLIIKANYLLKFTTPKLSTMGITEKIIHMKIYTLSFASSENYLWYRSIYPVVNSFIHVHFLPQFLLPLLQEDNPLSPLTTRIFVPQSVSPHFPLLSTESQLLY